MLRFLVLSLALLVGCRSSSEGDLGEMVNVADPNASVQLINGFYDIEQGWRWAAPSFAVGVKVPRKSGDIGATLILRYSLPDTVLAKLGKVVITPHVAGNALPPESLEKPGLQELRRDVPADWLRDKTTVRLEFFVSPHMAASDQDKRDLGLIVHAVGLARSAK